MKNDLSNLLEDFEKKMFEGNVLQQKTFVVRVVLSITLTSLSLSLPPSVTVSLTLSVYKRVREGFQRKWL